MSTSIESSKLGALLNLVTKFASTLSIFLTNLIIIYDKQGPFAKAGSNL